jgi:HAD superfamily hydrolase (TIGR01549 family)
MLKSLPTQTTAIAILSKLVAAKDLKRIKTQSQVVIMVGMPGSGKSTISELLVAAYGFWRFSSDQIRMDELFPGQEHRVASEHERVMQSRQLVYQELAKRVSLALSRGQRVVVDGTNLDDKREVIMNAVLAVTDPAQITLLIVKTPEKIMRARFLLEGDNSAEKWQSVYAYWKDYFAQGKATLPQPGEYPGVHLAMVQRYDLETFDWTINIGVLVWDIDQTLYAEQKAITRSLDKSILEAVRVKLGVTATEAKKQFKAAYAEIGSNTLTLDHFGLDGRRVMEAAFSQVDFAKILKPDPRLHALFKQLHQFHHVVLTNADTKTTLLKLKALGLSPKIFSAIYSTYDMPYIKPDRRVFDHVIKQTSFAPQQHLYIGDRLKADIIPAKAVGMRTALVWSQSPIADVSFDTVYQVGRLFGVEV